MSIKEEDGFRAWQRLKQRLEPGVTRPAKSPGETTAQLTEMDRKMKLVEDVTGEEVSEMQAWSVLVGNLDLVTRQHTAVAVAVTVAVSVSLPECQEYDQHQEYKEYIEFQEDKEYKEYQEWKEYKELKYCMLNHLNNLKNTNYVNNFETRQYVLISTHLSRPSACLCLKVPFVYPFTVLFLLILRECV